uniref:ASCH domain-containing protein n=1 Tax=Chromera velia CCMP2878 TaxID=1169474 RepID=A0A0G4H999_9ALVE|eukprot:Cvel_25252.t1-p1 / transcript=Cvel_25252.t1 / gene=Cvel_25252 / organism=Chromera_velia_CCMP2878 / gene_product=Activating signal cointegrator 1, putative / transcript_product=Activating signal cointegrator 1, putative / location=Cvel_scaffold2834:4388-7271(-) / protein_length=672 / sequence_SO=supercontig / SO=protein_coding / is_pseudo=false
MNPSKKGGKDWNQNFLKTQAEYDREKKEVQTEFTAWVTSELNRILQISDSSIVDHIRKFDQKEELREFLEPFAETDRIRVDLRAFVEDFFHKREVVRQHARNIAQQKKAEEVAQFPTLPQNEKVTPPPPASKAVAGKKTAKGVVIQSNAGRFAQGKKGKDLSASSSEGRKGDGRASARVQCLCQASQHPLVGNCLSCGKIVCEQEGPGPCLFCGIEVKSREAVANGNAEIDEELRRALKFSDKMVEFDRDAAKRTKVYDDQTDWYSEGRNQWLTEDQRAKALEKDRAIRAEKDEVRKKLHLNIDIENRKVEQIRSEEVVGRVDELAKGELQEFVEATQKRRVEWDQAEADRMQALVETGWDPAAVLEQQRMRITSGPLLSEDSRALYAALQRDLTVSSKGKGKGDRVEAAAAAAARDEEKQKEKEGGGFRGIGRMKGVYGVSEGRSDVESLPVSAFAGRDVELLPAPKPMFTDSEDRGTCMSMHQPWASLLILGFKRAEGRSWASDFKGRLWIHAASKEPEEETVKALESYYRLLYKGNAPAFPSTYPTSCLLGCVDVPSQVSAEEYKALQAKGSAPVESNESAFVFLCECPRKLVVPIPMSGQHKLWKLTQDQLAAWQRALRPCRWPKSSAGDSADTEGTLQPNSGAPSSSSSSAASASGLKPPVREDEDL